MTDTMFDKAMALHSQGRVDDAMDLYQQIVDTDPNHSGAIHLIGVGLSQKGHFALAVEFIKNAVVLNGSVPEYYVNLGNALSGTQDHNLAEQAYAQAGALNSALPEAWYGMGSARQAQGQPEQAVEAYKKAIGLRPDFVEALVNMAGLLVPLGRLDEAVEAAAKAATLRPDEAKPRYILAQALEAAGYPGEAAGLYASLIELPQCAVSILFDAANRLASLRFHAEAALLYKDALTKNPSEVALWNNLANSQRELDQLTEARDSYARALALAPDEPSILSNLGTVLKDLGEWETSEATLRRAVDLGGGVNAFSNLGHLHYLQGRAEQAMACFKQALEVSPEDSDAAFHLGIAELLLGQWQAGWGHYESRWKSRRNRETLRHQNKPVWDGGDLTGKTILIWSEQGLGDTLHFVRFAQDLAAKGGRVIVECQDSLVSLVAKMPAVTAVVAMGQTLPAFDVQVPLLSLPHLLGLTVENMPVQKPYFTAPVASADQQVMSDKAKIGLVWSGESARHDVECRLIDRRRSVSLDQLKPILALNGIEFVSLQLGPAKEQLSQWPSILDATAHIHDFADTAAVIGQLDGVISVDTSVAHLAGAMGKPIWMLSRFDGCWRWLKGRKDSPWYPTLSLYAQAEAGQWGPPVTALAQDVHHWVESR